MRLWTFQPRAVYDLIQETGVYRCEAGKSMFLDENDPSSGVFRDAYAWMVHQMEKRLGSRPEGVEYPVWAWYRYEGREKPDIRKARWTNGSPGQEMACILLEIPDREVLLSDFGEWHHVLNRWPLTETEEEAVNTDLMLAIMNYASRQKWLEKNWEKIFSTHVKDNGWVCRGYDLQATFWELKKENITGVKFFTGGKSGGKENGIKS